MIYNFLKVFDVTMTQAERFEHTNFLNKKNAQMMLSRNYGIFLQMGQTLAEMPEGM